MLNCLARASLVAVASAVVLLGISSAHGAPPASSLPAVNESADPSAVPNAAPNSDEGDLVETIDPAPATASVPSVAEPLNATPMLTPRLTAGATTRVPPDLDRFELHGWARQSLEIGLAKRSPQSNDADPTAVPYDQLTARTQLFMRARYSHARWFEASISGAVSYSSYEQAPAHAATTFDGVNGQSVRGVLEPELYELYAGFFTPYLDVRIGQQRVAWGNTELACPNDILNARDLRDPILSEIELQHVPTFMLRADLDLGFASLQGIAEPVYTPDRYDVYGSNWAAVQPDAPVWARGLSNLAQRSLDPTLQESAQRLFLATRYPKNDLTAPVLAARLSWTLAGVDVNHYYQYGFDGPLIKIDPAFAASLASIDFNHAGLADLEPWLLAIDAGQQPLQVTYIRRHHVGTDVATTLGPVALRLDAAYESKRVFFRRDLQGAVSPTFQGVLSVEYQTGDKDKLAVLEFVYLHLLDVPSAPLLVYARDTVALGGDVRWPLWRPLGFELRALLGALPQSAILQPELNLKFERCVVSAGGLWLDGEAYSLGQHFRRNVEGYTKVKLLF
jgi:hypothetical protein